MTFLWIFLPAALGVNYSFSLIKNEKVRMVCKNSALLVASLVFYAWGGVYYLLVMLASILGNYLFALWIDSASQREKIAERKAAFILDIVFNLGILFYFKYTNFFVGIIESIAHADFGLKEVVLPIGISFFTFQAMSYVIDVYLGKVKCQKNLLLISLYISFFPQLVAGPIVKYSDIEHQLLERKESVDKFAQGIRRFLYGLAKKVVISNVVGQVAETIFACSVNTISAGFAWLGIISYSIQIYFDFSGYSDMAIGLGKMFGFDFCENFNYPYMATSVQNFWRRWHISLSTWFKEYVYIPLGGNRKGKIRTYINLFAVFLLTGLWHGANYTFLLWGIFYGIFLVIERLFLGKLLDKNPVKIVNWLYTTLIVVLLWVFFRAPNVNYAFAYIARMFSTNADSVPIQNVINLWQWIILAVGILLCGPLQALLKKPYEKFKDRTWFFWLEFAAQILLLALSIVLLINNTFNPFIYFQF